MKDTQLIRLSVTDSSPTRAAQIVNTLAEEFTSHTKALQENRTTAYISSMQAKVEDKRKLVNETQAQVNDQNAKEVAQESELVHLQTILSDTRESERALQQDLQATQLTIDQLADAVKIVAMAQLISNPASAPYTASTTLLLDQGRLIGQSSTVSASDNEQLTSTYAQMLAGPPVLQAVIAELGMTEDMNALAARVKVEPVSGTQLIRLSVINDDPSQATQLADSVARIAVAQTQTMLTKSFTGRVADLQERLDKLLASIAETQTKIDAATATKLSTETELARLDKILAEYQSDYRTTQQSLDQMRLATIQAADTVLISERASIPQKPTQNSMLYVAIAIVVAGLLAMGAAFLIEYLDETIKTPRDVNHATSLSTVGQINRFDQKEDQLVVFRILSHPQRRRFGCWPQIFVFSAQRAPCEPCW